MLFHMLVLYMKVKSTLFYAVQLYHIMKDIFLSKADLRFLYFCFIIKNNL